MFRLSETKAMLASALASVRNIASKMQFVRGGDNLSALLSARTFFSYLRSKFLRVKVRLMTSTTIIMILAVAVAVLTVVVAVMVWLFVRKNRELKQKNEVIIREIYHSQNIIERAVKHGVSRAALL